MLGLEWRDIDFEHNVISVRRTSNYTVAKGIYTDTTKTKKSQRTLKFPQIVMDLLKSYKEEQDAEKDALGNLWVDTDRLFVKWNGKPMNNQTPYGWFKAFCQKHGFPFRGIHVWRHFHASVLINAGIDVVSVSNDLGHSTVATTTGCYCHMFQESKARNCEAITNALDFGKTKEETQEAV